MFTLAIGEEKIRRGMPTTDPGRHTEVIGRYVNSLPEDSSLSTEHAAQLGEAVMQISRDLQDRRRAQLAQAKETELAPNLLP